MIAAYDLAVYFRVDPNEMHDEIEDIRNRALAIVYTYLGVPLDPVPWDLLDVVTRSGYFEFPLPPDPTREIALDIELANWKNRGLDAAVLLVAGELWANREAGTSDPLSPAVINILRMYKPLVIA